MTYEKPKIDLICQHRKGGSIIPLRFRRQCIKQEKHMQHD